MSDDEAWNTGKGHTSYNEESRFREFSSNRLCLQEHERRSAHFRRQYQRPNLRSIHRFRDQSTRSPRRARGFERIVTTLEPCTPAVSVQSRSLIPASENKSAMARSCETGRLTYSFGYFSIKIPEHRSVRTRFLLIGSFRFLDEVNSSKSSKDFGIFVFSEDVESRTKCS